VEPTHSFLLAPAAHSAAEIAAISAIDGACFPSPTVDVRAELERPWARIWVARPAAGQSPIGFLLVWFAADEMHVLSLATHPDHRRAGIGRALLSHGLREARARDTRLVLLEVRRSNETAIRLYRAFGFSVMGVRARYYANGEDAIEMALVLEPGSGETGPDERGPRPVET
jgi:[ribosomal protein S18]-alanine N-acetyltransferase